MALTTFGRTVFPYAAQVGTVFCGQACTEMMLDYLQVPLLGTQPQATLTSYKDKNATNLAFSVPSDISSLWGKWASSPHQLVNMLHGIDLSSSHWINYFDKANHSGDFEWTRTAFLSALVGRTKDDSGPPPPIIPIHGNSHWVVLFQYAEKETNGNFSRSFIGNDPIYYSTKTGVGPSNGSSFSWEGKINVAHKSINFKNPENLLFIEETISGINQLSRKGSQSSPPILQASLPQPKIPIASGRIKEIVLRKLDAFGISSPCMAGRHLEGCSPSSPLLVRRMDRNPNDYSDDYYLVGMQIDNNENKLLARFDATTGLYLDSLGIPPTPYLLGTSTPASLVNNVLAQPGMPNELKTALEQLFITSLNPIFKLVWKPCTQSQSAFYPFYEIATPPPRSIKYYVRIDGRFFTEAGLTVSPNS